MADVSQAAPGGAEAAPGAAGGSAPQPAPPVHELSIERMHALLHQLEECVHGVAAWLLLRELAKLSRGARVGAGWA